MRYRSDRCAFTLIELLVVVAIIVLLMSILLPTLSAAREQGKKVKCLANLRSIGSAMMSYTLAHPKDPVIPIHSVMLTPQPYWEWRTAMWFSWGGRSGQEPFLNGDEGGILLADTDEGNARPVFDARQRPLNVYMYGRLDPDQAAKLEWFRCPSDRGYPDHPDIDDSPPANAERRCYDTLGNSYRASLAAITLGALGGPSEGHFSRGPWGHRQSTLRDPTRLVLVGEPAFFNMIGRDDLNDPYPDPVIVTGWHKRPMRENLLFCDGSARVVRADRQQRFSDQALAAMNVLNPGHLARGQGWQIDCYPVAGARLWGADEAWRGAFGEAYDTKWPFVGHQENMLGY